MRSTVEEEVRGTSWLPERERDRDSRKSKSIKGFEKVKKEEEENKIKVIREDCGARMIEAI